MSFRDNQGSPTIGTDQAGPYRTDLQVGDRLFLRPETAPTIEVQLTVASINGPEASGPITGYGPGVQESDVPAGYRCGTPHSCTKNQVQHHEYGG